MHGSELLGRGAAAARRAAAVLIVALMQLDASGHSHEGLKEYNLKGKFNFFKNTNLLIAYHDFSSNIGNIKYGQELDIIFKRKLVEEVSSELLDSKQSVVWEQAQNRMFVQQAIILNLL